jgi:hypothetical protein
MYSARLFSPQSPWYGATEPDHELSIALVESATKDMPYWHGLDQGIKWATEHPDEAAAMVAKVTLP